MHTVCSRRLSANELLPKLLAAYDRKFALVLVRVCYFVSFFRKVTICLNHSLQCRMGLMLPLHIE